MVNYSAYNVDPRGYQRDAMRNLQYATAMRDRRNQLAEQNDFNRQQQADFNQQRMVYNNQAQQRIDIDRQQFEEDREFKWKKDATEYAMTAPTPEKATEWYNARYRSHSGRDPKENIRFTEVGAFTTSVLPTPNGDISIRVRSHKMRALIDALNSSEVKASPKLAKKILSDAGAEIKPYKEEPTEWKPTTKAEAIEFERVKKGYNPLPEFVDRQVSNGLATSGYRKSKGGGYEKAGGSDEYGNPMWMPTTKEESAHAVKTEKYMRRRAKLIARYAKENGIEDLDEAGLQFEMVEASRRKQREKTQEKESRTLARNAAMAEQQAPAAAQATPVQAQAPQAKPLGKLSNGLSFSRGRNGYTVVDTAGPRRPTQSEMAEIQAYMRQNASFRGGGIPDVFMQEPPGRAQGWQGVPNAYNARRY